MMILIAKMSLALGLIVAPLLQDEKKSLPRINSKLLTTEIELEVVASQKRVSEYSGRLGKLIANWADFKKADVVSVLVSRLEFGHIRILPL